MSGAENLRTWIEALRSGKYSQAQGTLVRRYGTGEAFCCLGVGEVLRGESPDDLYGHSMPDPYFAEWVGLDTEIMDSVDPAIDFPLNLTLPNGDPVRATCAMLNDFWGLDFNQIADVIDYFGLRERA